MPKGYWVARIDITDTDRYKDYIAAGGIAFKKYGAHFTVRGGKFLAPEGTSRGRNVVIEFPSYQAALDCWHSPEYRYASSIRVQSSQADIIIVEGYDGPQPS
jgi:uncharacterized protein (DUF1330 family)